MKNRAKINKIEILKKSKKLGAGFLKNINKTDKHLAKKRRLK